MRFAVIEENLVTNVIVADEAQKEELEAALNARLENAKEYGLAVGDLWIPERGVWTRNIDGEQVVLEPMTQEDKVQYQSVVDELDGLQTALTQAYEEGVDSIDL